MTSSFAEQLKSRTALVNEIIMEFVPLADEYQQNVVVAMNYSLAAGGKRLRPLLLLETYKLFSDDEEEICYPLMAAIEMIHTFSLVHDDLPAIDNDEYRRGKKTTHVVYGEAMAILAGDGLLNLAYETVLSAIVGANDVKDERSIKALRVLAVKTGIKGMIGGQTADILAERGRLSVDEDLLFYIHRHKTAALIEAAMVCGAILGGADDDEIKIVEKAATAVGIAFQIEDDILDIMGDFAEIGKTVGSDRENDKITSVTLLGLDVAKERAVLYSMEAISSIKLLSRENDFLTALIKSLIGRTR
ncbi:MAG: polyprenyl synthetase family protein [Lachnospiraceae bacterium]|jgi:geranylgeranyl diphosphate synthase type II|nr:polyprenyl synthetase family protein [Lachnospiraceae bacterium]